MLLGSEADHVVARRGPCRYRYGGYLADIQSACYIDFKAVVQNLLQKQIAESKQSSSRTILRTVANTARGAGVGGSVRYGLYP